jgi:integrase
VSDFKINGIRFGPTTVGRKANMTKTEANRIQAEWKREARLGLRRKHRGVPTFASFAVEFLEWYATGRRQGSIRVTASKLKILNGALGAIPLDALTEVMIERFKRDRAKVVKPRTVNKDLAVIRQVLRTAVRWGLIANDPSAEVKALPIAEETPRILTDDDAAALLMACSDKLRPLVQFGLHTGLRYEELAQLTWAQIDWRRGTVTVEAGHAKNRKRRSIPLTDGAREALAAKMDSTLPPHGGRIFGYTYWIAPLYRAAQRANLGGVHPHTLRHTFASNCIMRGINPRTVQRWLGHSSLTQTERYTNPTEAHEHEAILVLDHASFPPSSNNRFQQLPVSPQKTMSSQ